MRKLLPVLALIAVAAYPMASNAAPKSEDYIAGAAGDTDGLCRLDNPAGVNIGAVCFTGVSGTGRLVITDASMMPVAGYYVAVDRNGAAIGSAASFCGSSGSFGIPSGTSRLVVYIGGPALGPLACIEEGWSGIGTNGTVKLTL